MRVGNTEYVYDGILDEWYVLGWGKEELPIEHEECVEEIKRLRDQVHELTRELDNFKEFVVRTATDKNLRSRKACYHARRVCLEAGAILAEMNGTYEKGSDQ